MSAKKRYCFGILHAPYGDKERGEVKWACCNCRFTATQSTAKKCAICNHRRCEAPSIDVVAAARAERPIS